MKSEDKLLRYGVYTRLIDDIMHYDTVQATYRTMTSSLLLASFAAIGFLYSLKPNTLSFSLSVWLLCVCSVSFLAITMMAIMDLISQERFMIANVIEALKLETEIEWLPKIHHKMLELKKHPASPNRKSWFYIGCGSTMILIGGHAVADFIFLPPPYNFVIYLIALLTIVFYALFLYRISKSFEEIISEHFQYKQINQMNIKN